MSLNCVALFVPSVLTPSSNAVSLQLLKHLRPELELRLNIEPGDDEAWEEIIDGAAEGVEQLSEVMQAPDVWVRASIKVMTKLTRVGKLRLVPKQPRAM